LLDALALAAKLPVVHGYKDNLGEGLISYGPDLLDLYRRAARLVDKIDLIDCRCPARL
jgi:hypothetical protein